jgi:hypothetical protein
LWDAEQQHKRETCFLVKRGQLHYVLARERLKPGDEILPWPDDEEQWL